jgi:hypothetical protein
LHYIANADKPRLVLFNKEEREKVLTNLHNGVEGAHQGIVRTQDKVKRSFYWLTITADVEQWVNILFTQSLLYSPPIHLFTVYFTAYFFWVR